MAEYIKKADAVKTLMQMQWHDEDGCSVDDADEKKRYAEDWVNCMPTIEIVHCKDCKHRNANKFCSKLKRYRAEEGFCSKGEM